MSKKDSTEIGQDIEVDGVQRAKGRAEGRSTEEANGALESKCKRQRIAKSAERSPPIGWRFGQEDRQKPLGLSPGFHCVSRRGETQRGRISPDSSQGPPGGWVGGGGGGGGVLFLGGLGVWGGFGVGGLLYWWCGLGVGGGWCVVVLGWVWCWGVWFGGGGGGFVFLGGVWVL